MRPSERKAKRKKEAMLKGLGIGAAVVTSLAGGTVAIIAGTKNKKSDKTEDKLADVIEAAE